MPIALPTSAADIIFFGGSFDPPHCGHLAIAEAAQQALAHTGAEPARVLFAPVGRQPLKPAGSSASFQDRVAMTRLAIANHPTFELSLADAPDSLNNKPNYTIDTLLHLRAQYPLAMRWHILLGADAFRTFHHWRRAAEIPFIASLIVAGRPGEDLSDLPSLLPPNLSITSLDADRFLIQNPAGRQSNLLLLPDLHHDISATQLRDQIDGLVPKYQRLLPQPVLEYIHHHRLYS